MTVNRLIRLLCAGLLGVGAALLLLSCGSSGKGLIPVANAGPLQSDFEAVAQAAQSGEGDCSATEAALVKTERDFTALPASIDLGLRKTLSQGIANLRRRALKLCEQPLPQVTSSTSTPTTTSTQTSPTTPTETTTTQTTTTPTTPTSTTPGGGTPAPGNESSPGTENGPGGGTGIGGENGSGAGGPGAGGAGTPGAGAAQEGGK
jgi:hypothetical protein